MATALGISRAQSPKLEKSPRNRWLLKRGARSDEITPCAADDPTRGSVVGGGDTAIQSLRFGVEIVFG